MLVNEKIEEIIEKLNGVIEEGYTLKNIRFFSHSQPPLLEEQVKISKWITKANTLIESILNKKSEKYLLEPYAWEPNTVSINYFSLYEKVWSENIAKLEALKESIEDKLIFNIEKDIINEFATDLYSQARKFFKQKEYLPTVIYGRIITEQVLRKYLEFLNIEYDKNKDSATDLLNNKLVDKLAKAKRSKILSIIQIGNDAIHNLELPKPEKSEVKKYLRDIEEEVLPLLDD